MGPWLIDANDRSELESWLAGGPSADEPACVMFVRGDGPGVRGFLPNALDAAKRDPRRVVVWVKDRTLLGDAKVAALFGESETILAVVLSAPGNVGGWVTRDRLGVEDAAFAFDQAEEARA